MEERVFEFFKTFVDAPRLRLAALLIEEALTVEEMAARLSAKPADVARGLAQIEKLGLLRAVDERRWQLDAGALEKMSRETLSGSRPPAQARSNDEDADDYDSTVVRNYSLPDGRLRDIPAQARKRAAILRHVVQVFEPGVRYNEKQVNEALKRFYADYASLRRYLFDDALLQREPNGTAYWRDK